MNTGKLNTKIFLCGCYSDLKIQTFKWKNVKQINKTMEANKASTHNIYQEFTEMKHL